MSKQPQEKRNELEEHLQALIEAIESYRIANSEFITAVLDAKLNKKDSENIRGKLRKVEPSYWPVEHQLKMLDSCIKQPQEHTHTV